MQFNSTLETLFKKIIDVYITIPEVTAPQPGAMAISGHSPLNIVKYDFIKKNYFWTCNYNLELSCDTNCISEFKGKITLAAGNPATFKCNSAELKPLVEKINNNIILCQKIRESNIYNCSITFTKNYVSIKISPFSGACVKMLIPPITYPILPSPSECICHLQIIQLLIAIVSQS